MRDKREKNKDREIYIIIKGMHDRLRSRRRSKGRKGARHILRSIYVSYIYMYVPYFPLDQSIHPSRLGVKLRER